MTTGKTIALTIRTLVGKLMSLLFNTQSRFVFLPFHTVHGGGGVKNWPIGKDPELGKIEGRRRRGWQRMRWLDGITDQQTWASFGSWRWTGKPGMLQSMWSQRVVHGWVTELNWGLSFVHDIYHLVKFILSTYLSYNWKSVPFDCLHPISPPSLSASSNHKSNLFCYEWVYFRSIIDLKHYIRFSYTT